MDVIDPTGPFSPTPNAGDFWFNRDTLEIFEYDGSSWVSIGSLIVASVFKLGVKNILFSNPQSDRSLVLSHLDYIGNANDPDSDGTFAYRFKSVGVTGLALIQLAIEDPNNAGQEMSEAQQARIFMDAISDGGSPATYTYKLTIENPSDDIFLDGAGSNFRIVRAAGSPAVSKFEFNSTAAQLAINSGNRALTFASSVTSGLKFHIGLHSDFGQPSITSANSLTTSSGRLFTVTAAGKIGVNNDAPLYWFEQSTGPSNNNGTAKVVLGVSAVVSGTPSKIQMWRLQANSTPSVPTTLDGLVVIG